MSSATSRHTGTPAMQPGVTIDDGMYSHVGYSSMVRHRQYSPQSLRIHRFSPSPFVCANSPSPQIPIIPSATYGPFTLTLVPTIHMSFVQPVTCAEGGTNAVAYSTLAHRGASNTPPQAMKVASPHCPPPYGLLSPVATSYSCGSSNRLFLDLSAATYHCVPLSATVPPERLTRPAARWRKPRTPCGVPERRHRRGRRRHNRRGRRRHNRRGRRSLA